MPVAPVVATAAVASVMEAPTPAPAPVIPTPALPEVPVPVAAAPVIASEPLATVEPVAAQPEPAAPVVVAAPPPAPVAAIPVVAPTPLQLDWSSGLTQIETARDKAQTVVTTAVETPRPRRTRPVLPPVVEEPLMQVETGPNPPPA